MELTAPVGFGPTRQSLALGHFDLGKIGLIVHGEPAFETWEELGGFLNKAEGAVHWWIGDWLNYGEAKWGEKYAQAIEATGFAYDTLAHDKYVASQIELWRRRHNLPWSHHREVAPLMPDQQDELLAKAEKEEWSRSKLRQEAELVRLANNRDGLFSAEVLPLSSTVELADAAEWLAKQEPCDLLLTDPPYSTDVSDIEGFAKSWLLLALSKVKPTGRAYIFIGAYPEELLAYLGTALPTQVLVWTYRNTIGPKADKTYMQNWQAILYYCGPEAGKLKDEELTALFAVQDISAPDARTGIRWDKWEKPMTLARRIIMQASREGDSVLDAFAGTGTFLLAAADLGRVAKGCDNDQAKVDLMIRRGCRRA